VTKLSDAAPLTVLTYNNGSRVEGLLVDICGHLAAQGVALAGMIQIGKPREGRSRCDMVLEDLKTGTQIEISEDRGPFARGCMLAVSQLLQALELASRGLDSDCDLLVINKFGKTESEGGGFRPLIVEALSRGIPVLIAVPAANLDSWRHFADGLATEYPIETLECDPATACRQLQLAQPEGRCGADAISSAPPGSQVTTPPPTRSGALC